MYLWLLLVFLILCLSLSLFFSKGDLFSPACVADSVFLFSLSLILLSNDLRNYGISSRTFFIFVVGFTVFNVVSAVTGKYICGPCNTTRSTRAASDYLIMLITLAFLFIGSAYAKLSNTILVPIFLICMVLCAAILRKIRFPFDKLFSDNSNLCYTDENDIQLPDLPIYVIVLSDIFSIGIVYKLFDDIRISVTNLFGHASLSEMINIFRQQSVYAAPGTVGISMISSYGCNLLFALSLIFAAILIQYHAAKRKLRFLLKTAYAVPIICYISTCFLQGSRGPVLCFSLMVITYYITKTSEFHKKNVLSVKMILYLLAVAVLLFALFFTSGFLIGRRMDVSLKDIWYYILRYAASSVLLFDQSVTDPLVQNQFAGKETLAGIYRWIGSIIDNPDMANIDLNKEFRTLQPLRESNIYTAFREPYNDFGIIGVIVCFAITAFCFSFLYAKLKKREKPAVGPDLMLLLYSALSPTLFMFSIDDRFFQFMGLPRYRNLLCILGCYLVFTKVSFKRFKKQ